MKVDEREADASTLPLRLRLRRPRGPDWPGILRVLKTANFHRIGGPEMPRFPLRDCFVAELDGRIVGVGGYRVLTADTAKTTLLAVDPACRRHGIGELLQRRRQDYLRRRGIRWLYTNSDDDRVIAWYLRRFGYRRTGRKIPKVDDFGRRDRDHWVNLRVDLTRVSNADEGGRCR